MQHFYDDLDEPGVDEAADTMRFARIAPDATSIYDLNVPPARYIGHNPASRRMIRDTRANLARLHEALASGWDVGPELAHEERYLTALEGAC